MHREMRRKDRLLSQEETMNLLSAGEYGVLSMIGDDNAPYAVPLSYTVDEGAIWFHCAQKGQKIDSLEQRPKVCFTVVGKTQPVYQDSFSTYYESVVVHGTAALVTDPEQKRHALRLLCEKYLPQHMDKFDGEMERTGGVTAVVRIAIDAVSGKAKRDSKTPL